MSKLIQSRAEFQTLADVRLAEARALLDAQLWDGAYYLAGYAIELALKSCVIRQAMIRDAFPDKKYSENCYTHNLEKLVEIAGLGTALQAAMVSNHRLSTNWGLVEGWSEVKRYHRVDRFESEELYRAVNENPAGVLPWIRSQW